MTVYAVNDTKDSISDAERFGELKYINYRYVFGDEIRDDKMLPLATAKQLRAAADEFDPEEDYVVIVGDQLQLVAFVAELSLRYDSFNVLRWDRHAKGYYPVRIKTEG